ncbi:unnamed protein product [Adineta ricciae]|nr:unnamed protein product [Adineta ricciae]
MELGIARGLTAMNEENVAECNRLADNEIIDINFAELSSKLDSLNPVQCFDILDKLCNKYPSTKKNDALDELILKFVIRFRINGGFFIALKQPADHRQHLIQRLNDTILTNEDNIQKTNLTLADIH